MIQPHHPWPHHLAHHPWSPITRWQASVCLLHATLGGGSRPMRGEFRHLGHSVNSHRDIEWLPPALVDGEYNESVPHGSHTGHTPSHAMRALFPLRRVHCVRAIGRFCTALSTTTTRPCTPRRAASFMRRGAGCSPAAPPLGARRRCRLLSAGELVAGHGAHQWS